MRERAAAAVEAGCRDLIAAAGPACVAVKPQLARFEALGAPGWQALEAVVGRPSRPACWSSPTASGATCRSAPRPTPTRSSGRRTPPGAPIPGSAPTRSPSTRCSAPTHWSRWSSRRRGRRRHLRPGQDLAIRVPPTSSTSRRGGRSASRAARPIRRRARRPARRQRRVQRCRRGRRRHRARFLARLRELMPRAIFLLPGVGAQGGSAEQLAAAFTGPGLGARHRLAQRRVGP